MSRKDKASDGRRKDCFLRRPSRRALPHLPISDARASLCIVKILQNPPTFIPKSTPCEPICSPHCCKYEEGAPSKRHELRHGWQGPQHEDLLLPEAVGRSVMLVRIVERAHRDTPCPEVRTIGKELFLLRSTAIDGSEYNSRCCYGWSCGVSPALD